MTKENFTFIGVIMDGSGSMSGLRDDTIGSFNTFLADQKALPDEAVFTHCVFNSDYRLVHDFVKLSDVPNLSPKTYSPNGGTALLDAMGTTINSMGAKLAAMPEDERPSKVIVLIITDGQENASRNFTKEQIKSMVELQTNVYNWSFVFMGANIDAISEGAALGISMQNSVNYEASKGGTASLYSTVSNSMTSYRSAGPVVAGPVDFFNQAPVVPTPATPKDTK